MYVKYYCVSPESEIACKMYVCNAYSMYLKSMYVLFVCTCRIVYK
jgi:hypothetical protein